MLISFLKYVCLVFVLSLFLSFSSHSENLPKSESEENLDSSEKLVSEQVEVEQKKYYQIDLILFEHRNNHSVKNEHWSKPKDIGLNEDPISDIDSNPSSFNASEDIQPVSSPVSARLAGFSLQTQIFTPFDREFKELDTEHYHLLEEYQRIKQSGYYNSLAYLGWIQPGLSSAQAKTIEIFGNTENDINGHIKIVLSRYLHAHINLTSNREICIHENPQTIQSHNSEQNQISEQAYNPDKQVEENDAPKIATQINKITCHDQNVTFRQSRKMRSKELHYIDNPALGVLILITPVENPETEIEPEIQQEQQIDIENA